MSVTTHVGLVEEGHASAKNAPTLCPSLSMSVGSATSWHAASVGAIAFDHHDVDIIEASCISYFPGLMGVSR